MGGIAILIALAAVILHHVEARRPKPAATAASTAPEATPKR